MEQKYKMRDLAKDLSLPATTILDVVHQYLDTEKKPTASLTQSELNVVIDKVSQENEVSGFDDFFKATTLTTKKPEIVEVKKVTPIKNAAAKKNNEPKKVDNKEGTAHTTSNAKKTLSDVLKMPAEILNNVKDIAAKTMMPKATKDAEKALKAEVKAADGKTVHPIKAVTEHVVKVEVENAKAKETAPVLGTAPVKGTASAPETAPAEGVAPVADATAVTPVAVEPPKEPVKGSVNAGLGFSNTFHSTHVDRPVRPALPKPAPRPLQQKPAPTPQRPQGANVHGTGVTQQRPPFNNAQRPQNASNNSSQQRPPFNNAQRPQNATQQQRPPFNNANNRPQQNNGGTQFGGQRPPFQSNNQRPNTGNFSRPTQNNMNAGSSEVTALSRDKRMPKMTPKTVLPGVDISTIKVNEPPSARVKGQAVAHGEVVTKHVDTRGNYVELDKYNEKYEKIAQQDSNKLKDDGYVKKQKINQKSLSRKGQFNKQRETESQKLKRLELERARKQQLKVSIPDEIVVSELAIRLKVTASDVIKKLFTLGEMCTINQVIDFDTAALVADEYGAKVEKEVTVTIEERLFEEEDDTDDNLVPRSPVVVVMGHVDHGKTSLLDKIRNASVAGGEAGGITQKIGAYRVAINGKDITFLDTPGHEAFTAMRARGANATDIAVLVVAADDGIMPQTVEAINHAKAAGITIIVAINKIDKDGSKPERIKQELTEQGLVIEEWGGDTICVEVSAKTGEGIDTLLEMIAITADVMELKANPDRMAKGVVIEASLDKGKGTVATLLVQNGTLHTGDIIIAGASVGRVRVMHDDKGRIVKEAEPSVPVEITGLAEVPSAGDIFAAVEDEKLARELVAQRKFDAKEEQFNLYQKVTLENLFSHIEEGLVKELPIIIKADLQGSAEAVKQSLEKLTNEEVRVRVIHDGVGAISESDVMLASASNAIIVGFNVRPNPAATDNAKRDNVQIRLYSIIYDAIAEIETAMKGMLAPKFKEVVLGKAEVREVYKITNVGAVAGSYVLDGKIQRNSEVRVIRDSIVIATDKIESVKRFKDDVKEATTGYECGLKLAKFNDFKPLDILESFIMEQIKV